MSKIPGFMSQIPGFMSQIQSLTNELAHLCINFLKQFFISTNEKRIQKRFQNRKLQFHEQNPG